MLDATDFAEIIDKRATGIWGAAERDALLFVSPKGWRDPGHCGKVEGKVGGKV